MSANAHSIYEDIKRYGESELLRPTSALAFSGLAAGLSMGFSFLTEVALRHHLPATDWTPLVAKLGYTLGFVIVILGRQQLFTENTLSPIIPLLDRRSGVNARGVARLWIAVFVANVIGALIFAYAVAKLPVFDADWQQTLHEVSLTAYQGGEFTALLVRGVFAGWLIALIAWLMPPGGDSKLWIIVILAYVIGIAGFPHIIAGSVDVLYGVAEGAIATGDAIGRYMLPTLIGNVIGGVTLVAALNYAQVASGDGER